MEERRRTIVNPHKQHDLGAFEQLSIRVASCRGEQTKWSVGRWRTVASLGDDVTATDRTGEGAPGWAPPRYKAD